MCCTIYATRGDGFRYGGRMIRVLILAVAMFAVCASASANEPIAPVASECVDGIDNDGDDAIDGYIDYTHGYAIPLGDDAGCFDDSPETELLTRAERLSGRGARIIAKDATDDVFRHSYRNAYYEKLKCRKKVRTRYACEMVFATGRYVYAARVVAFNYVDRSSDSSEWGYHLRGWKFTEQCAQRDNPFKCASKRYRA